jgi:hypothetical protein
VTGCAGQKTTICCPSRMQYKITRIGARIKQKRATAGLVECAKEKKILFLEISNLFSCKDHFIFNNDGKRIRIVI